jgi:AcrR family transcriptional regulator
MASEKTRRNIVDGFMALLAERPLHEIGLDAIAARADVSLGDLRAAYDGPLAILAEAVRRIDREVLDGIEPANGEESHRDRLFDVIMRRLDRLAPYKGALANLEKSARRDPALALCLNRIACGSARFMLAAAGIDSAGLRGVIRSQGLVFVMGRVYPVWRDESHPDLSRTMAALDRALDRAQGWSKRSDRAASAVCAIAKRVERRRRPQRHGEATV